MTFLLTMLQHSCMKTVNTSRSFFMFRILTKINAWHHNFELSFVFYIWLHCSWMNASWILRRLKTWLNHVIIAVNACLLILLCLVSLWRRISFITRRFRCWVLWCNNCLWNVFHLLIWSKKIFVKCLCAISLCFVLKLSALSYLWI